MAEKNRQSNEKLSDEEIEKLMEIMEGSEEIRDFDGSEHQALSMDDIDDLLSTIDEVDAAADSALRQTLLSLRDCLRDFGIFCSDCENLRGSSCACDICLDDEETVEPFFAEKLTAGQQEKFDEYAEKAANIPRKIRGFCSQALDLIQREKLAETQIGACGDVFRQLADEIALRLKVSEIIPALPDDALAQFLQIRKSVFLEARRFFASVAKIEKSPLKLPPFAELENLGDKGKQILRQFLDGDFD